MKNSQKGFIVPILLVIIALLVVGGGVYIYKNKKTETPSVVNIILAVYQPKHQALEPISLIGKW